MPRRKAWIFEAAVVAAMLCTFVWSQPVWAGPNAGARAWLSWDRPGLQVRQTVPMHQPQRLYVQFEGLHNVRELALGLRWTSLDSTSCVRVVSSTPDPEYGWAVQDSSDQIFGDDSTYRWSIHFPALSEDRNRIVYSVTDGDCSTDTRAMFRIVGAMVSADNGEVDTLTTVGIADLTTTTQTSALRGMQHTQEDASTAGYVLAHIVPGTLGYDGDHIVLSDFLSPASQSQLSGLGFQSGMRVFGIDARVDTLVTTEGGVSVL